MAGGKRLLVADDSLTIQKVIRLALSNEGYDIQAISDGGDAIQQIATFRPDCVLIDVSLPTHTAFEIKREVNSMPDHQGTRFILMSSAFEKIDEAQAAEVGFDGRLTKPFDPAHLRQVLAEVLSTPVAPRSTPPAAPQPPSDLPDLTLGGFTVHPPREFPTPEFAATQSEPSETPEAPETPESEEDELWGRHEEPPPPLAGPEPSEKDEIKQLTESTIRMSGLAEWEVNEPSLKPPGSLADIGESTFSLQHGQAPQPVESAPAAPKEQPKPEFTRHDLAKPEPSTFTPDARMEEMIRHQVQETLEKMAQQILPEVAERVIKAEIHRLLNEKL